MATILPEGQEDILAVILREKLPSARRLSTVQLVAKVGRERFEDGCTQVFDYLETSCGQGLTRNEQLALLSKVLDCLIDYIQNTLQIPCTPKTMFDCIHLVPYATELAFPGYAEAGLLRAVIMGGRLPVPMRMAS
jgi:hypothetical protein